MVLIVCQLRSHNMGAKFNISKTTVIKLLAGINARYEHIRKVRYKANSISELNIS